MSDHDWKELLNRSNVELRLQDPSRFQPALHRQPRVVFVPTMLGQKVRPPSLSQLSLSLPVDRRYRVAPCESPSPIEPFTVFAQTHVIVSGVEETYSVLARLAKPVKPALEGDADQIGVGLHAKLLESRSESVVSV